MHARAALIVAGLGLLTTFASVVPASAHPGGLAAADVSGIAVLDRPGDASSAAHALAAPHALPNTSLTAFWRSSGCCR